MATIKMKRTKSETARYRLLRLGVSIDGEEERQEYLASVLRLFQRCVQNAD